MIDKDGEDSEDEDYTEEGERAAYWENQLDQEREEG